MLAGLVALAGQLLDLGQGGVALADQCRLFGTYPRLLALHRLQLLGGAAQLGTQAFLHAFAMGGLGRQAKADQRGDQGQAVDGHLHVCLPALRSAY